jgi:hypothetical protein
MAAPFMTGVPQLSQAHIYPEHSESTVRENTTHNIIMLEILARTWLITSVPESKRNRMLLNWFFNQRTKCTAIFVARRRIHKSKSVANAGGHLSANTVPHTHLHLDIHLLSQALYTHHMQILCPDIWCASPTCHRMTSGRKSGFATTASVTHTSCSDSRESAESLVLQMVGYINYLYLKGGLPASGLACSRWCEKPSFALFASMRRWLLRRDEDRSLHFG